MGEAKRWRKITKGGGGSEGPKKNYVIKEQLLRRSHFWHMLLETTSCKKLRNKKQNGFSYETFKKNLKEDFKKISYFGQCWPHLNTSVRVSKTPRLIPHIIQISFYNRWIILKPKIFVKKKCKKIIIFYEGGGWRGIPLRKILPK